MRSKKYIYIYQKYHSYNLLIKAAKFLQSKNVYTSILYWKSKCILHKQLLMLSIGI